MNKIYYYYHKHLRKYFEEMRNFFDKLNNSEIIVASRRGLILTIPFMIVGAFSVFINNIPINAYQQTMLSIFGESWKDFGGYVWQATFGIMSVIINISISYVLAESKKDKTVDIHPMINASVSLSCLFVLINTNESITNWIGPLGVFTAIASAFISSEIYIRMCTLKRFKIKLFGNAIENDFFTAIQSFFPVAFTIVVFGIIRATLLSLGLDDIHNLIYDWLNKLFSGLDSSFSTGLMFVVLTHIFWFLGLHGNNMLEPVAQGMLVSKLEVNMWLVAQGLPPTEIITKQFFDVFVFMGGSGTTLCLIIALIIGIKRYNTRQVASMSILPGLINVNEIIIYGMPVVWNFFLLIPFILVPTVLTMTSYIAMYLGLVPLTIIATEWTTPIFIGGYIVTGGSMAGAMLQLFNLIVGVLLYLPFVRMYERSLERESKKTLNSLMVEVLNLSQLRQTVLLNRKDAEGTMARLLVSDLIYAIKNEELILHYQPLINEDGSVFGVEALLRWKHKQLGSISPPIIIAVAEEAGLIYELGTWTFKTAMRSLRDFKENGIENIVISVNITPSQLDDLQLIERLMSFVKEFDIDPRHIDIEITEQTALGGITRIQKIKELKKFGFNIAMDDFGMGHGSLVYLKDLNLDVIKIDGSLINVIESNLNCRDIIATIVQLCSTMDIHVIAEFVENEKQKELLKDLGCFCYQGHLYSPALSFDKVTEYIKGCQKSLGE